MNAGNSHRSDKPIYRFGCREVGANCDFVATGFSVEEVRDKWFMHAVEVHANILNGMSEDQKAGLTNKVVAIIKQR